MQIPVSISELLEVRGAGLNEYEIWSLINASARPLAHLLAQNGRDYDQSLSAESLFLLGNGSIEVNLIAKSGLLPPFLPPEFVAHIEDESDFNSPHNNNTESSQQHLEQAIVYSLGAICVYGRDYGGGGGGGTKLDISPELLSLLNLMMVKDPKTRPTLPRLSQMASNTANSRQIDAEEVIKDLYKEIMGSTDDLDTSSPEPVNKEVNVGVESISNSSESTSPKEHNFQPSPVPVADEIGSPLGHSTKDYGQGGNEKKEEWASFDESPTKANKNNNNKGGTMYPSDDEDSEEDDSSEMMNEKHARKQAEDVSEIVDSDHEDSSMKPNGNTFKHQDPFTPSAKTPQLDISSTPSPIASQLSSVDTEKAMNHITHESIQKVLKWFSRFHETGSQEEEGQPEQEEDRQRLMVGLTTIVRQSEDDHEATDCRITWWTKRRGKPSSASGSPSTGRLYAKRTEQHQRSRVDDSDPFEGFDNLQDQIPLRAPVVAQIDPIPQEQRQRSSPSASSSASSSSAASSSAAPEPASAPLANNNHQTTVPEPKPRVNLATSPHQQPIPAPRASPTVSNKNISNASRTAGIVESEFSSRRSSNGSMTSAKARRLANHSIRRGGSRRMSNAPPGRSKDRGFSERSVDDGLVALPHGGGAGAGRNSDSSSNKTNSLPLRPKGMGGPEFLYKSRLASIRVKAPTRKRAAVLGGRVESTGVQVCLLSGQRVEVECRTDSTAADIFDSVVNHTNLSEHFFFGITILKDGEYFFLDPEAKLLKTAPPGWSKQRKNLQAKNVYTLYLRLKFYPTSLDFIKRELIDIEKIDPSNKSMLQQKTETTLHEMYLQLRRDVIDEKLQTDRDTAFQLAALGLQAEYGDPPANPNSINPPYFFLDHYLPHRHFIDDPGADERMRSVLTEMHGNHYSGLSAMDAESEYLKMCQKQREYGIHFYRLYKSKPSSNLDASPLGDPETGLVMWIGIMPRGIIIFEERGSERVPVSQYPWASTQTLQYNRKKFVIVPQSSEDAKDSKKTIFFTDTYKKSRYFVKFAATQHRFCMKMRQWTQTLDQKGKRQPPSNASTLPNQSNSTDSGAVDLGAGSRETSPDEVLGEQQKQNRKNPNNINNNNNNSNNNNNNKDTSASTNNNNNNKFIDDASVTANRAEIPLPPPRKLTDSIQDQSSSIPTTVSSPQVNEPSRLHPNETTDMSISGDKITGINGVSLDGKNRHDAVNLVKNSSSTVQMDIMRLKALHSEDGSSDIDTAAAAAQQRYPERSDSHNKFDDVADRRSLDGGPSSSSHSTRRPPHSSHNNNNKSSSMPVYSSKNIRLALMAEMNNEEEPSSLNNYKEGELRRSTRSSQSRDSSVTSRSSRSSGHSAGHFDIHGEADPRPPHPNQPKPSPSLPRDDLYRGYDRSNSFSDNKDDILRAGDKNDSSGKDLDDEIDRSVDDDNDMDEVKPPTFNSSKIDTSPAAGHAAAGTASGNEDPSSHASRNRTKSNDWVDEIRIEEREPEADEGPVENISVTMGKVDGSLGIKIAGGSKGQNRVNGANTSECTHQEVVEHLKSATSPVTLGLTRQIPNSPSNNQQLPQSSASNHNESGILVRLEKPASGSLGLSLARPSGGEGIYVRVITPGSVADQDGRLQVGDRLWKINEDVVAEASPLEVVEKLKAADGFVDLLIKRK